MGIDVTTIIFALLAIFVVWKLKSVLGTRTGTEKPPHDPFQRRQPAETPGAATQAPGAAPAPADEGKVVRLPGAGAAPRREAAEPDADRWKGVAEPGSPVWQGLDAIAARDPSFDARSFLDGARAAYEMIVNAFAQGDRATLKTLLAPDVYESFAGAIGEREGRGEKAETTFVSIDKAGIEEAQLRGSAAQIAIRFVAKMINATRDKAGAIVDGSPDKVVETTDLWTFARDVASRDPNWKLVHTTSGR